ncbi:hypothetical protein Mgra_00003073, partial [Meloidogyne graminicola]
KICRQLACIVKRRIKNDNWVIYLCNNFVGFVVVVVIGDECRLKGKRMFWPFAQWVARSSGCYEKRGIPHIRVNNILKSNLNGISCPTFWTFLRKYYGQFIAKYLTLKGKSKGLTFLKLICFGEGSYEGKNLF